MQRRSPTSIRVLSAVFLAATWTGFAGDGRAADFSGLAREMRTQLADKILPYWFDTAQDTNQGGYLLDDDAVRGRRTPAEKQIVTQSRMVWGFSRAHLAGYSDANRNYLAAATQGYHFLLDHFLDRKNGGYFWSTDLKGKAVNDGKFLYGESFVIYALVEYYRASGDPEALRRSLELYRAVQAHFYDAKNGGWFEHAERNWKILSPGKPQNAIELIGCKSANAHLHWMEALTELYAASRDPAVKESLSEALRLNQTYFYPEYPGQCAFFRSFDWQRATGPGKDGLSYGHNVEFAWLMIRAETVLGREPSWNRFYALLDHALKYGGDDEHGGLYNRGVDDQPSSDTEKVWWVQAEWLAALTDALNHQSDPRYEAALNKLLRFIQTRQADPKDGIWLYSVTADGRPRDTTKANSWKANYHDVRGMLKFIEAFAPERPKGTDRK
jgi:mannose 2-epimerase